MQPTKSYFCICIRLEPIPQFIHPHVLMFYLHHSFVYDWTQPINRHYPGAVHILRCNNISARTCVRICVLHPFFQRLLPSNTHIISYSRVLQIQHVCRGPKAYSFNSSHSKRAYTKVLHHITCFTSPKFYHCVLSSRSPCLHALHYYCSSRGILTTSQPSTIRNFDSIHQSQNTPGRFPLSLKCPPKILQCYIVLSSASDFPSLHIIEGLKTPINHLN